MTGLVTASERLSRAVAIVASVWFAFTAFWGLCGISASGHLGAGSVGNVMAAEQIVRWHLWYPAWGWYVPTKPLPVDYICHHPFGQYYVPALFLWVFGHHDFVVHLPAALMSSLVPPMLYGIGKERWGAPCGAIAAASYVVVPVAVGFSSFNNLETYCIFGSVLFFWGHSRHLTTRKRRYLVASLVGVLFACAGDWAGYLLIAPTVVWSFLRCFVLPARMTPRIHFPSYARWWGLTVGLVAGTLLFWLALFTKADQIGQWVMAAMGRGGGDTETLKTVLIERAHWIDFSFTPLAIKLGKLAWPVCFIRLLWTRRDEESYSLSLLFGATVQYVVFKQGAEIHVFWSIYFAPYFALALAQLVHTGGAVTGWVLRQAARVPVLARVDRWRAPLVAWGVLGFGLVPAARMAHDGFESLWVWHRTGGRYDENGSYVRSNLDLLDVVEQVLMPKTTRGTLIDTNGSAGWGWEQTWKWQGTANDVGLPGSNDRGNSTHPFWIGRGSGLMGDVQRKVVAAGHVRIYGDTWIVDQREPVSLVDAYAVHEREPNWLEWLFVEGTEPRRSVGSQPDPWLTWEIRDHLDQAAIAPTGMPATLDEIRIAHNLAVSRGDAGAAEAWREKIDAQIDRSVRARYDDGVELIGVRRIEGVQPRIESWFEVTGDPIGGDVAFAVRSYLEAQGKHSLIPPDTIDRDMAQFPPLPTKLWKSKYIYSIQTVMNHRIGRERYKGYWVSRDGARPPVRVDGKPDTTLAVVE